MYIHLVHPPSSLENNRQIDPTSSLLENPLPSKGGGGGMDIFWNLTMISLLIGFLSPFFTLAF